MNAFLLLSTAWVAGADPVPAAAPVAAPVVVAGTGCGSGCGTSSCCSGSCDSCGKVSLLDKIRARFAKSDCGCSQPATTCCEKAPKCHCERAPRCKPACGTPLFAGRSKGCDSCNTCNSSCDSCSKPSLLDKLRARFASRKSNDCCGTSTCCNAAPAGCSLPPAPNAAPVAPPAEAPKTMPKKSTSLTIPSDVTPASSSAAPAIVVPAIPMAAPAPTPVLGGAKSPF